MTGEATHDLEQPLDLSIKRPARRAKMTTEVQGQICAAVAAGSSADAAARIVGVSPSTMRNYKRRHPSFRDALARADAIAEENILGTIRSEAARSWRAAAWMAERKWPAKYAKPEVQAQLGGIGALDTDTLVAGIHEALTQVAKIHADFSQPDAEDELEYQDAAQNAGIGSTPAQTTEQALQAVAEAGSVRAELESHDNQVTRG